MLAQRHVDRLQKGAPQVDASQDLYFQDKIHGLMAKEPQLDNLIQDIGRPKEATLLKEYFQMLPYYDFRVFVQITSFVYYLLTKQQWSVDEIIQKNNRLNIEKNVWQTVHQPMVQQENETNLSHHDPLFEKKFFQMIKEGNLDEIKKYEILHPTYGDFGLLSTDSQLRNQKNIGIVAIALATRAAIEAGLDSETAYSLSDLYIQRLEKMQAIAVVDSLISEAVIDFTQRVHRINCALYSKEIVHAKNYLYSHLYQHFSLGSLAKEVALHPNYLSRLFKKEVGKTLSTYLLEEKVKEAKRLIVLSDYSLSEISSMLQFYDQSHFSRVFKKYAGFTPIEYKNQQGIKEF